MENTRTYVLIAAFLAAFLSGALPASAYETNTHAYLTSEAIALYNKSATNNAITNEWKRFLIDGVIHEDDMPRLRNHFYDPINDEGLTDGLFAGTSAKIWANDGISQNKLEYQPGADSSLAAIDQQKIDQCGNVTDFSWDAGLRYWLKGDKEMAMVVLGHILHLVEDMGMPEHTRNDSHTDGSVYEEYASRFNSDTPDEQLRVRLGTKKPLIFSSLDEYFDGLATYSNNYFYSPGSIGMYDLPELDYRNAESMKGEYYFSGKDDEGIKYYLAVKHNIANIAFGIADVSVEKPIVQESYWNLLSVRTVRYSAGVIDLFFKDIERVKNDPTFLWEQPVDTSIAGKISAITSSFFGGIKNVAVKTGSFFGNIIGAIGDGLSSAGSFIGGLFTNDNGLNDMGVVDINDSASFDIGGEDGAAVPASPTAAAVKKDSLAKKNAEITALQMQIDRLQQEAKVQDEAVLQLEKKPLTATTTDEKQEIPQDIKKVITDTPFCAYGSTNRTGQSDVVINEVAWMGGVRSASDEWIELKNVSGRDVDVSQWQLLNKGGGIKIRLGNLKTAVIKPGEFVLLERTDNNSAVGVTADLIYSGALGNTNDGLKLLDASCGVADEIAVAAKWLAGNNDTKQTMERTSSGYGWQTSASTGGTPGKDNSFGAVSSGGSSTIVASNTSQSGQGGDSLSVTPQFYPIVINEIMYSLDGADDGREWIELYNAGTASVDIGDWKLFENDTNHGLVLAQGLAVIPSGSYAIITDDKGLFLTDNPDFSGSIFDSSFSLKDDGESLIIKNGTLTIDSVTYASSTGANGNGMSLQKFSDGWAAASSTPGAENVKAVVVNEMDSGLEAGMTESEATSSQLIRDTSSGSLSVLAYYQSLATSTAYTIESFSIYGSGVAGMWRGGVCEFNNVTPFCNGVLAQVLADKDMPSGDSETLLTFEFSTPVVLNKGTSYALFVEPTGSVHIADRVSRVRGSATNTYLGGSLFVLGQYAPNYISEPIDSGIVDMYFVINPIHASTTAQTGADEIATTTPQSYPIAINEIMYDLPGSDDGREWIELYNAGTSPADISGWKFFEGETNHGLVVMQGASVIAPGGYAVIVASSTNFLIDNPGFSGSVFDSAFSLSNTGETLVLKNGDLVIDTVAYIASTSSDGTGMSLQKFSDGWQSASSTSGAENVKAVVANEIDSGSEAGMTEGEVGGGATTTDSIGDAATTTDPIASTSTAQLFALTQSVSDARSATEPVYSYLQGIGTNSINTIKSFTAYVDGAIGQWRGGICESNSGISCNTAKPKSSTISRESVVEKGTKTLLTFDFGTALSLNPSVPYFLFLEPPYDADLKIQNSSAYGSSANTYSGGGLGNMVKYPGDSFTGGYPGIADMYFEIN